MKNIFLVLVSVASFSNAIAQMQIGDSLPNSSLRNVQNETVDMSSFKGKIILVDFGLPGVLLVDWLIKN